MVSIKARQKTSFLFLAAAAAVTLPSLAEGAALKIQRRDNDGLSDATIQLVKARLAEGAVGSWENGTRAQALLEYDHPELAVFYNPCLPIPSSAGTAPDVNAIAAYTIANKPANTLMFTADGSAADPASLGVAILLANATQPNVDYMTAINQQNQWLLHDAPRTPDGALSHRVSQVQLWSDFVYMVPPYLAYYGAIMKNQSMVQAAYDQIRMYRNYLVTSPGLWRHIQLGDAASQDPGHWLTGNGWAAMGSLRVLATMMHSPETSGMMAAQKQDLQAWTIETLQNAYKSQNPATGLLPNYLGETTFEDAAGTALLAASSYRLAQLGLDNSTLTSAHAARKAVFANVDTTTGWVAPVVNERDWSAQGEHSPEGQSFVLMLSSAYRDYTASPYVQPEQTPGATPSSTPQSAAKPATDLSLCLAVPTIFSLLSYLLM